MKKNFFWFWTKRPAASASWVLSLLSVVLTIGLTACDPDPDPDTEPEPEPTPTVTIKVSPSHLSLGGNKAASASFTITTDTEWAIRCDEDWLKFSGISGEGNTTITVTTTSANEELDDRVAIVKVMDLNGLADATLEIAQETVVTLGCRVTVEDPLYLSDSMAATFGISSSVGYFYFGCYSGPMSARDDAEIIETLPSQGQKVELPFDDVWTMVEMVEGDTYTINLLAFDKQGNRGELTRTEFTVPVLKSSDGWTQMGNGSYDANYWYWTTLPSPQTSFYYMIASEGDDAITDILYTSTAQIAYRLREKIRDESATANVREGNWKLWRTTGSWVQYAATWSADAKGNLAPMLNSFMQMDDAVTGRPSRVEKQLKAMKAKTGKPEFRRQTAAETEALSKMRVSWK